MRGATVRTPQNTLAHRFAVMWHSCTELAMLAPKVQVLGKPHVEQGDYFSFTKAPYSHAPHTRPAVCGRACKKLFLDLFLFACVPCHAPNARLQGTLNDG
jgi:hypothetical protein